MQLLNFWKLYSVDDTRQGNREKSHTSLNSKFRSHSARRDETGQELTRLLKTLAVSERHTIQAGVTVVGYMLGLTMRLHCWRYFAFRT